MGYLQKPVEHVDNHTYLEPSHCQNSLYKYFRSYLGIFRDIDAYSATLTSTQLERESGGSLPYPFLKVPVGAFILERKALIVSIFWVKFYIKNVVLIVSRRKNSKLFLCEIFFFLFFSYFLRIVYWIPQNFRTSTLKVWQCSEYDSVSITAP